MLPLLPSDFVLFPADTVVSFVGRPRSMSALRAALASTREVFVAARKHEEETFDVGVVAEVREVRELSESVEVTLVGRSRARIARRLDGEAFARVEIEPLPLPTTEDSPRLEAAMRRARETFAAYLGADRDGWVRDLVAQRVGDAIAGVAYPNLASHHRTLVEQASAIEDGARLADFLASTPSAALTLIDRQTVLEMEDVSAALERLAELFERASVPVKPVVLHRSDAPPAGAEGPSSVPVAPLRVSLDVSPDERFEVLMGRAISIDAVHAAIERGWIGVVAQKDSSTKTPTANDLSSEGLLCLVEEVVRLPDGTLQCAFRVRSRIRVIGYTQTAPCFVAKVQAL